MAFVVAVCSARLPDHSQIVHGKESEVETNKHQGENKFTKFFIEHSPSHFREPKIKSTKQTKQGSTDQYIMKMGYDEIGVLMLCIDGNG